MHLIFLLPFWYSCYPLDILVIFVTVKTSNQVLIWKKDEQHCSPCFFCFPCFPKSILTKFVRSVRPSIVSIIRNHSTDLLLQNADKNAYEKITILRKNADGYAVISLTLHSFMCVFFFFLGFLSRTFTNHRTAGKG